MAKKIYNAWELQNKVNEVDNKAEKKYVEDNINKINSSLDNKITTTKTELKQLISDTALATKKALHPVNSIYLSMDSTNPNTLFGFGTWQRIAEGKTLIGVDTTDTDFNTAGKTGGSKTHSHDSGSIVANIGAIADDLGKIGYIGTTPQATSYGMGVSGSAVSDMNTKKVNHATTTSGNTANASSLQPYITVYIWKRIK